MSIRPIYFFIPLLLLSSLAAAKTVYISDIIYVPLRGGQSTQHKVIHKGVKSGTRLELIEENSDTKYSLVRTPEGLEGWVHQQYLTSNPIARNQLKSLSSRLEKQKKEFGLTLKALQNLEKKHKLLQEENADLNRIKQLSVDVISVDKENTTLKAENESFFLQTSQLEQMIMELESSNLHRWFMAGAATILLGLLFGFVIARRIYNRSQASGW